MIIITKAEAKWMREHDFGYCVKKSYSKHPTYYLVEEQDDVQYDRELKRNIVTREGALTVLHKYRESCRYKYDI